MSATVEWDTIDSGQGRRTADGWELTRGATVTGCTTTGQEQLLEAYDALGVSIGAAHPDTGQAQLEAVDTRLESQGVVRCQLRYKRRDLSGLSGSASVGESTYQIGASLQAETSNEDADGDPTYVKWTNGDGDEFEDSPSFTKLVPSPTLEVERTEDASPGYKAMTYVGRVNSEGGLDVAEPAAAARTWLCTGIVGTSTDSGETWHVRYSFEYKVGTWDTTVWYRDPDTGNPPSDWHTHPNANQDVQVYNEIDFNALDL